MTTPIESRVAARFQERTATKVDDLYNEVEKKRLELQTRFNKLTGDRNTYAYATMWPDTSMSESTYMDANYSAKNRQRAIRQLTKGLKTLEMAEKALDMLEKTNP
jgi:hypothetical protein